MHFYAWNIMQYHAIPCNTIHFYVWNIMKYHAIPCNTMQYHAIPCNTMQYHAIQCNDMLYHAISCNTMQYNGTLITADGAYHCPVGSIMAIFSSVRSSYSHPDLLVIHPPTTPLFQITPVLNIGLSLSEPLQLYKVNRCLARYSPRATTTNRPINRALNKPGPN